MVFHHELLGLRDDIIQPAFRIGYTPIVWSQSYMVLSPTKTWKTRNTGVFNTNGGRDFVHQTINQGYSSYEPAMNLELYHVISL